MNGQARNANRRQQLLKYIASALFILSAMYVFAAIMTSIEMHPLSVQGGIVALAFRAAILTSSAVQLILILKQMYASSVVVALIPAILLILYMG